MNWVEGVYQLCTRRCSELSIKDKNHIVQNEAAFVNYDPLILLYRYNKRPRSFPAMPHGALGYDPNGAYAMNVLGVKSDVIYIDDVFYTAAQSEVIIPGRVSIQMVGKQPGLFTFFRKKGIMGRWKINGNGSLETVEQIAKIVQTIDSQHTHFYEIVLFPNNDNAKRHTLVVRTNRIPWELGSFSSISGFISMNSNGYRLNSSDAAVCCMENLVRINLEIHQLLYATLSKEGV